MRIRNYKAMKDEKLRRVYDELQHGGDAYERAIYSGSGNPDRDLRVVEMELTRRETGAPHVNCPECGAEFVLSDDYLCAACRAKVAA